MDGLGFSLNPVGYIPQRRRIYPVAFGVHAIVVIALIALVKPYPVRMNSGGTIQIGIAAFNPGSVGAAGTAQPQPQATTEPAKKRTPSQITRATAVSRDLASDAGQSGGAAGTQGTDAGSGPVNLGTGAGLTLLRKVVPTYPRLMEQAHVPGMVVLDAIIHREGTIGDITVKSSTNGAFAQAAIEAVKQWRYSPIPYEGIVTVTVNFNLSR